MSKLDLYSFSICLIVYILLVVTFSIIIYYIYQMNVKLIRSGIEDERIRIDRLEKKYSSRVKKTTSRTFSIVFCVVFVIIFSYSLYLSHANPNPKNNIPVPRVVLSDSMAKKHNDNEYLKENNLNNQFDVFDIILTYKLPKEKDLKLYDVVVYEYKGNLIIHRIVGIEEPNDKHPNERYFQLQGDNSKYPDAEYVTYSQMKAIYYDNNIPYMGAIVSFLQSGAGILCMILIVIYSIVVPVLNSKIENEELARYYKYNNDEEDNNKIENDKSKEKQETNAKKKNNFYLFLILIVLLFLISISRVSAKWIYPKENTLSSQSLIVEADFIFPYLEEIEEVLADKIINDTNVGLNNPNSYLNDQIEARINNSFLKGGQRDTLGSMAIDQGSQLNTDFNLQNLADNDISFIIKFNLDNRDNVISYELYITDVYLGTRGACNWLGNNTVEGHMMVPEGEYIYPIFKFTIEKDNSGKWVATEQKVGSAKSAWYEESRSNEHASQIPAFDPDTWVEGNMTI